MASSSSGYSLPPINGGADISTLYAPYVSGSTAITTGYKLQSGADISTLYMRVNPPTVANGDFSSPTVTINTYTQNPSGSSWTASSPSQYAIARGTGSTWWNYTTPGINQYAVLFASLNITQTILFVPGSYTLTFRHVGRNHPNGVTNGGYSTQQTLSIDVGSINVVTGLVSGQNQTTFGTATYHFTIITSGSYIFKISTTDPTGSSAILITNISITNKV